MQIVIKRSAILLSILGLFLANKMAIAADALFLPNPGVIGSKIAEGVSFFDKRNQEAHAAFPDEISIDLREGIVVGLMFTFGEQVKFEVVKSEIDSLYGKWAVDKLNNKKIGPKVWRVSSDQLTISLDRNEQGCVQVIMMKWFSNNNEKK